MFAAQQAAPRLWPNRVRWWRFATSGLLVCCVALAGTGCAELRARHAARKGNELFREGNYAEAVRAYEESQRLFPEFPISTLNLGLACRQMMSPGSDDASSEKAADCALEQFKRLQKIAPEDERGAQLYEQTLFDANRYAELEKMYLQQFEKNPQSLLAVNALVQVYTRWDKWEETLKWETKRAELSPNDPDAQYSLGVLIFNHLLEHGGSGDVAKFDPREGAINPGIAEKYPDLPPGQVPPFFTTKDVTGAKRIELADLGLARLQRALELRSDYTEAMVFTNLLYRQKAIAYFSEPEKWQENMTLAEQWRKRVTELQNHTHSAAAPDTTPGPDQAAPGEPAEQGNEQ